MTGSEAEAAHLEYDRVFVRTLALDDLDRIVRIDESVSGRSRRRYLETKLAEALEKSRVIVSLGAEVDGHIVGFLMGRLYFGEYGVPEPVAILDTIGVHPDSEGQGVGAALMNQFFTNLRGLGIPTVRTEVEWNDWGLLGFLETRGFTPARRVCLEAPLEGR